MGEEALRGEFRYRDTGGVVRTANLLQIAGGAGFVSTVDPIISKTLSQIASLTDGNPGLRNRVASNADYNRNNLDFQSKGGNYRKFPTTRLDYNVTDKHHLEFVYNYQTNLRSPDGVNIGGSSPIFQFGRQVFQEIDQYKTNGPTAQQASDAKALLLREFETSSKLNNYLLSQIAARYQSGEDPAALDPAARTPEAGAQSAGGGPTFSGSGHPSRKYWTAADGSTTIFR